MVPLPAQGIGARLSPTPDVATRDRDDAQTFVGHLWLMQAGAWQVRLHVDGAQGTGELAVPVPALPARTKRMQTALGVTLLVLLLVLAAGAVSIAGAGAREGELERGAVPSAKRAGARAACDGHRRGARRSSRSSAATRGGTPRRRITRRFVYKPLRARRARRRRHAGPAARRSRLARTRAPRRSACPITATSCTCTSCASRRSIACGTCIPKRPAAAPSASRCRR